MKAIRFVIVSIITIMFLAVPCFADNPWLNKTRTEVMAKFGEPKEIVTLGDNCDIYYYHSKQGQAVNIKYFKFCDEICVSVGQSQTIDQYVPYSEKDPYYRFPEFNKPIKK